MAEHAGIGREELRLQLLILRCQTGDERAFAQLFGEFSGRTLAYLKSVVGEGAEDVQQEVWLAVYRGLGRLDNARAFRTWLYSTTRHRAIDYLRSRKREQELLSAAVQDATEELESAEEREAFDEAAVSMALNTLPAVQREVLLLRYRDDLSYAEIALVVGCSVGTVRSRLHHARQRMQGIRERSR
jgi:RNA polymerase sigma-70 factor (ECF subfamily)